MWAMPLPILVRSATPLTNLRTQVISANQNQCHGLYLTCSLCPTRSLCPKMNSMNLTVVMLIVCVVWDRVSAQQLSATAR